MKKLVVGRFSGAFGIKGWIKVQSFTGEPTQISNYKQWYIGDRAKSGTTDSANEQNWQPLVLEKTQWQGGKLVVLVKGCSDRDQVKLYSNREIAVDLEELPALEDDEFYWHELIGLTVIAQTEVGDKNLGLVADMLQTGANDVLIVQAKGCAQAIDKKERLIPYLPDQVVKHIDLDKGEITVDWDPEF